MSYENILLERDGSVATITINREKVRNALNRATIGEIGAALREIEGDDGLRVALVTGAGEKAFVAGADISELQVLPDATAAQLFASEFHTQIGAYIASMTKPVVAVINGFALGGGCELALACDIRLASDAAKFGLPEITLGIMPGWGGTQRMARLAGASAAKLLALTGDIIDATEALRLGVVDRVYPAADLRPAAVKLAQTLASRAPISVALIKQAINEGIEQPLRTACDLEAALFGQISQTEDAKEGTTAFLEKRPATWKGR